MLHKFSIWIVKKHCINIESVHKFSLSACSPIGKGGWRGILRRDTNMDNLKLYLQYQKEIKPSIHVSFAYKVGFLRLFKA
jgi:hypothetical protein